jgi:hypothetical protein
MTSFSVTSFKKAISEFQEDSVKFPTQQKSNPLFSHLDGPVNRLDALLCREDFDSSPCIRPDVKATRPNTLQCSKNLDFICRQGLGKTTCNHPDARATPSRCDLNMETREARYGKVVVQFTVRTLFASVQTPPREIRISVDLGLLSQ